jgi:hypothetical protein
MARYELIPNLYLLPTPGGAYYAATTYGDEPARALLFKLMSLGSTPLLNEDLIHAWTGSQEPAPMLELLFHMQSLGWVQGLRDSRPCPQGALEEVLPALLANLSSTNKALLADNDGFYIASHGYPHETAEQLSALSGDLASLYQRHRGLLRNKLGIPSGAWAVVDAAGDSQIGFWPMYIGAERFVLVISGLPRLNQPAFTDLVWALAKRYGEAPAHIRPGQSLSHARAAP